MLLQAILQGLALGLFLAIQPGPSFFALLQTSSKMGFRSGLALAFGIFLSDVVYVVLSYLGVAQLFNNEEHKKVISLAGGAVLVVFGLVSIFHKKEETNENKVSINAAKLPLYISKGFLLNFLNPSVLFLWVLYVGLVSAQSGYSQLHIFFFFTTTLAVVFTCDGFKAYYANKISQRISEKVLKNFNLLLGLILLITGLVFIYRVTF
jgi:threonine/homoserine/homoserine lactone efflux protein